MDLIKLEYFKIKMVITGFVSSDVRIAVVRQQELVLAFLIRNGSGGIARHGVGHGADNAQGQDEQNLTNKISKGYPVISQVSTLNSMTSIWWVLRGLRRVAVCC